MPLPICPNPRRWCWGVRARRPTLAKLAGQAAKTALWIGVHKLNQSMWPLKKLDCLFNTNITSKLFEWLRNCGWYRGWRHIFRLCNHWSVFDCGSAKGM
jgi:hypothetical protein